MVPSWLEVDIEAAGKAEYVRETDQRLSRLTRPFLYPPARQRPFLIAAKVDADTSVPYCVVGSPPAGGSSGRFFNLVVCHDLFDNYERMKIVVAPVIARYPGAQVR